VRADEEKNINMATGKEMRKLIKGKRNNAKQEKGEEENGQKGDVGEREGKIKGNNK
jgi:hypothetical protein